jgi:hypothetical protein
MITVMLLLSLKQMLKAGKSYEYADVFPT